MTNKREWDLNALTYEVCLKASRARDEDGQTLAVMNGLISAEQAGYLRGIEAATKHCDECAKSEMNPDEIATRLKLAAQCDAAVARAETKVKPLPPLTSAIMDQAWESAITQLRTLGVDPDALLKQAAENVDAFRAFAETKVGK